MKGIYHKLIKALLFSKRFYGSFIAVIVLFILSYSIPILFSVASMALVFLIILFLADYLFLFYKKDPISLERVMAERFSNADDNVVTLMITNNYPFRVRTKIIDEVPDQFQWRNTFIKEKLEPSEEKALKYVLHPLSRGVYNFYDTNVLVHSPLNFVVRHVIIANKKPVKVYPSFFALRQYTLNAHLGSLLETGNKKVRKLGQSLEFEQIREYVTGDDLRNINWNATARKGGQLMINSYTDERSQQVYCLIDKGRVMKMPFEGMALLDYAINASVLLSHVALLKQDKAGLVTYSDKIDTIVPAGRKNGQMNNILEVLYAQQTSYQETDFEKLYIATRIKIPQRSLLLLFTNFESFSALQRQLPYIKSIANNHLLIVIFFENTELESLHSISPEITEALYTKTIAEKFMFEKRLIVKELQKHGVMSILSSPKNLTVNTINKYLEIKSRQAI